MTFTTGQIVAFIIGLLGAILTILNIIDKSNALKAMKESPFKALSGKVEEHEVRIGKIESSLFLGNDRFREQEETNATFKSVMLSFVNFEIAYCLHTNYPHTEELMNAKRELEQYLTGNNHEKKDRD